MADIGRLSARMQESDTRYVMGVCSGVFKILKVYNCYHRRKVAVCVRLNFHVHI